MVRARKVSVKLTGFDEKRELFFLGADARARVHDNILALGAHRAVCEVRALVPLANARSAMAPRLCLALHVLYSKTERQVNEKTRNTIGELESEHRATTFWAQQECRPLGQGE